VKLNPIINGFEPNRLVQWDFSIRHNLRARPEPDVFVELGAFEKKHGVILEDQDLRMVDFKTRVRPVPSQSPRFFQPLSLYTAFGFAGMSGGKVLLSGMLPLQKSRQCI
jgi:hypothetical protein